MLHIASSSWSDTSNLFGSQQLSGFPTYPLYFIIKAITTVIGLKATYILVAAAFILAAIYGTFRLLLDLGVGITGRLISIICYLASAVYFDYFLMGWHYILMTFSTWISLLIIGKVIILQ